MPSAAVLSVLISDPLVNPSTSATIQLRQITRFGRCFPSQVSLNLLMIAAKCTFAHKEHMLL